MRAVYLTVLAVILLGLAGCGEPRPDLIKTYEFWTAGCGRGASLFLQDTHGPPIWDQDEFAWGIGYRDSADIVHWLYNDAETGHPHEPGEPAVLKYVGWEDADGTPPGPTYDYTPMPPVAPGRVILFDPSAGLKPPGDYPRDDPPLINIFIDPDAMSAQEFAAVVACLSAQKEELNAAMVRMRATLPLSPATRFVVLRLGGIAYETPPFGDPAYMSALKNMRSAVTIPAYGDFSLYPGRTATGRIAGHTVRVSAVGNNDEFHVRYEVDGAVVARQDVKQDPGVNALVVPDAPTNVPGVSLGDAGLTIDGPACEVQSDNCGERIAAWVGRNKGLLRLSVGVRSANDQYLTYPDWSAEARAARRDTGDCTKSC